MSILSGEYLSTSGDAYIDNYNIKHNQRKIRNKIGYCSQFDALFELLTVREHLDLYACIKGLKSKTWKEQKIELNEIIELKLNQLDLNDFEHVIAGALSGG